MKKFNYEFLIILFIISSTFAVSRTNSSLSNNQNKQKSSDKNAEPRGYEPWGILDAGGYGGDVGGYGKSDYYWLIPLVIVIGFGALLIPLLGTLMTTMITQGTINLTAGRKKRSLENERLQISNKGNSIPDYIFGLLTKVEDALEKFESGMKNNVSPLKSKI